LKADRTKGAFDDAQAYQRFIGRWSGRLAERFLDFTGLNDGERVLDVGCGTGNLALTIAARAPLAQVIGVDPSAAYVEFARSRTKSPNVQFMVGSAGELPFADSSFDRVLCQLVLNFIPDCSQALGEMRRVARPGAVIAAVLWQFGGMRLLDEFWAAAGPGDKDGRYGERSSAFTKEEVIALWNDAALSDVTAADLTISTDFESFDDYWSPFLLGQGPSGAHAVSLPPDEQRALRERLRDRVLSSRPDGPFSLEARAFAVRGIR
jgi:SAM-dependent methyltransferase